MHKIFGMEVYKKILGNIARNYKIDPDELLISLWDYPGKKGRFDYLKNSSSLVKTKDLNLVRELLKPRRQAEINKEREEKIKKPIEVVYRDFNFSSVGKPCEYIEYIEKEEALGIHGELVHDFTDLDDPIYPPGLKDEDLLMSALFHPRTSYIGKIKYSTIESAAAALMYSLSHNHAFHNGNKRTAIVATLVFLDKHHICLTCSEDDLFQISIKLADHQIVEEKYLYADGEIYELARWIHTNSRAIEKGERSITLKKLKQILTEFGCVIQSNNKVLRIIKSHSLFSSDRKLISRKPIGTSFTDGDEIDKGFIKALREDLELTPEHGVDSKTFYSMARLTSSEFIIKYKNVLKRLSRV